MKKLFFIFAVALSTVVNAQIKVESHYFTYQDRRFFEENGFDWYICPEVRYCVESGNFGLYNDSLVRVMKKLYKPYAENNNGTFKRVTDTSYIMTFGEYLDSKIQYNPTLNFIRIFNIKIKTIVHVPSHDPNFTEFEIVEYFDVIDNIYHVSASIMARRSSDGVWISYASEYPIYPEYEFNDYILPSEF